MSAFATYALEATNIVVAVINLFTAHSLFQLMRRARARSQTDLEADVRATGAAFREQLRR